LRSVAPREAARSARVESAAQWDIRDHVRPAARPGRAARRRREPERGDENMIRGIAHFMRHSPEVLRCQKEHPRAEFLDIFNDRADSQGYAEVRRELVGDLTGSVLEIGCGTGSMFRYYDERARVDAIEPEADFLERAIAKASQTEGRIHA